MGSAPPQSTLEALVAKVTISPVSRARTGAETEIVFPVPVQGDARAAILRTVFQLRPVHRVPSFLSIKAFVRRERPNPFG